MKVFYIVPSTLKIVRTLGTDFLTGNDTLGKYHNLGIVTGGLDLSNPPEVALKYNFKLAVIKPKPQVKKPKQSNEDKVLRQLCGLIVSAILAIIAEYTMRNR